jgi:fluoride exporter
LKLIYVGGNGNFKLLEAAMRRYLYIGGAGVLGSLTRYFVSNLIAINVSTGFPLNTFIINISGCFLLGFFLTSVLEFIQIDPDVRLAVATGFIGSYTTFSTFTNEINTLFMKQELLLVLFYFILSFVAGVMSIWIGVICSRKYFCSAGNIKCED